MVEPVEHFFNMFNIWYFNVEIVKNECSNIKIEMLNEDDEVDFSSLARRVARWCGLGQPARPVWLGLVAAGEVVHMPPSPRRGWWRRRDSSRSGDNSTGEWSEREKLGFVVKPRIVFILHQYWKVWNLKSIGRLIGNPGCLAYGRNISNPAWALVLVLGFLLEDPTELNDSLTFHSW